jgi:opacity protein-like surface antigen
MLAHHSRKVLLAAMLAAGLSAPALANDAVTTAQQTAVGQGTTTELASVQDSPVVVKESYATVTNGPAAAPRARAKVAATRQPSGGGDYYRASGPPLILGIRH